MGLGTGVAVLNSQVVPISQVVVKRGFPVPHSASASVLSTLICKLLVGLSIPSYDTKPDVNLAALAVVSSDGTVFWVPQAVTRTRCTKDESEQWSCQLKFSSWVYNGNQLDLNFFDDQARADLKDLIHGNWQFRRNTAVKKTKYFPCCPDQPFPSLTYKLKLSKGKA